jgi:predicted RNase H-like nuclease (RuvC/YqgF family)
VANKGTQTMDDVLDTHFGKSGESKQEEEGQVVESAEQAEAEVPEDEKTEVAEEAEVSEAEKPDPEKVFQERYSKEYAKIQRETIQPLAKERDDLKKKLAEAENKLSEKEDLRSLKAFGELDENEDENTAAKNAKTREDIIKRVREWEKNRDKIEANLKKLERIESVEKILSGEGNEAKDITEFVDLLGNTHKEQMAYADVIKLYEPAIDEEMRKYVKRLQSASSPEHYQDILKSIKAEAKASEPKQEFDSGRQGGGASGKLTMEKIKKMSPEEKFNRSKEIKDFFDSQ